MHVVQGVGHAVKLRYTGARETIAAVSKFKG